MKYFPIWVYVDASAVKHSGRICIIGEHIKDNTFKILPKPISKFSEDWKAQISEFDYDSEIDDWEFPPDTIVRCEWFISEDNEPYLLAVEQA